MFRVILLSAAAGAMVSSPALAGDGDPAGFRALFAELEAAFKTKDQAAFERRWHPKGVDANLVGGSGLSGQRAFDQGTRKGWYLKCDADDAEGVGAAGPWIVPCDIWSWKKGRSVDGIHAVIVKHDGRWVILGGGERRAEVRALAERYRADKPLAPPSEGSGVKQVGRVGKEMPPWAVRRKRRQTGRLPSFWRAVQGGGSADQSACLVCAGPEGDE